MKTKVSRATETAKPRVQEIRGLRRLGVFETALLRNFREVGFGGAVLEARDEDSYLNLVELYSHGEEVDFNSMVKF